MRTYFFWCFERDGRRIEDWLEAEHDDDFHSKLPGRLAERSRTLDEHSTVVWLEYGTLQAQCVLAASI